MADPRCMVDAPLYEGAEIALDSNTSRHVGLVLRLRVGDPLRIFNARDGEWRALVTRQGTREMAVRLEALLRSARAAPDLDLVFSPVKRQATDLIVEKATELGVRRLQPVITRRTIAQSVRGERLSAIAQSAAEQTERFDTPEILPPLALHKCLGAWDASRPLIYADESGDEEGAPWGGEAGRAPPLLAALPALKTEKLALLIGPEGGFAPDERDMLRACAFVTPVSLGPRILRAETAVIAALSVIQSAWGDWR
jgi:16S rRNA (uracil1498-N3)-methyltransferase